MAAGKGKETLLERIIIVSLQMQEMESEYLFLPLCMLEKHVKLKRKV